MQTLVIAHAAFGHNHFFKNNYLFRSGPTPTASSTTSTSPRATSSGCEERYGHAAVERLLDAAHALMSHGVHRYPRKQQAGPALRGAARARAPAASRSSIYNDLWRTVPDQGPASPDDSWTRSAAGRCSNCRRRTSSTSSRRRRPRLQPWQREILRIVRLIAQYFYPQRQTKVMNEGCATYCHYQIMTRLHERGRIGDGAFLEFLHSHTNVVHPARIRRSALWRPEPLCARLRHDAGHRADLRSIRPTRTASGFPTSPGTGDPYGGRCGTSGRTIATKASSLQFLSPRLIRELRLFHLVDDADESELRVEAIHDERGYRRMRRALRPPIRRRPGSIPTSRSWTWI